MKLHFYADSGHGWLKAPLALIADLGLADKISGYSYMCTTYAYLEEDVDAPLLVNALKERGKDVSFTEHYSSESAIRNYSGYKPEIARIGGIKDNACVKLSYRDITGTVKYTGRSVIITEAGTQARYKIGKQILPDYVTAIL